MKIDGALKVKNKNFICQRMNARDIKEAFYVDRKDFMDFVYDYGGRAKAGYKGNAGDCVCRSIAIVRACPSFIAG